jgi:hypothetical protein
VSRDASAQFISICVARFLDTLFMACGLLVSSSFALHSQMTIFEHVYRAVATGDSGSPERVQDYGKPKE